MFLKMVIGNGIGFWNIMLILLCSWFIGYFGERMFLLFSSILLCVFSLGYSVQMWLKMCSSVDLLQLDGLISVVMCFFGIFRLMFLSVWNLLQQKFNLCVVSLIGVGVCRFLCEVGIMMCCIGMVLERLFMVMFVERLVMGDMVVQQDVVCREVDQQYEYGQYQGVGLGEYLLGFVWVVCELVYYYWY